MLTFTDFITKMKDSDDGTKTIIELAKENNINLTFNKFDLNEILFDSEFEKFITLINSSLKEIKFPNKTEHFTLVNGDTEIQFKYELINNNGNTSLVILGDEFYILSLTIDLLEEKNRI